MDIIFYRELVRLKSWLLWSSALKLHASELAPACTPNPIKLVSIQADSNQSTAKELRWLNSILFRLRRDRKWPEFFACCQLVCDWLFGAESGSTQHLLLFRVPVFWARHPAPGNNWSPCFVGPLICGVRWLIAPFFKFYSHPEFATVRSFPVLFSTSSAHLWSNAFAGFNWPCVSAVSRKRCQLIGFQVANQLFASSIEQQPLEPVPCNFGPTQI